MGGEASKPEEAPRSGPEIRLNVYTPGNTSGNQQTAMTSVPGFGIYHTGIQIFNREHTFAGGDFDGCGVQEQEPKQTPPGSEWVYNQTIELGKTNLTEAEVKGVLSSIRSEFPARSYELMSKNCNHFTEVMSHRLNVHDKYPSWVNRAAKWGSSIKGGSVDVVAMEKKRKEQKETKIREERQSKALLAKKQGALKPEPPIEAEGVVEVQINCPNGSKVKRRFVNSDTIKDVMDFTAANDISIKGKFHLRMNFPRKIFKDTRATLKDAGLQRKENLFVERAPE